MASMSADKHAQAIAALSALREYEGKQGAAFAYNEARAGDFNTLCEVYGLEREFIQILRIALPTHEEMAYIAATTPPFQRANMLKDWRQFLEKYGLRV